MDKKNMEYLLKSYAFLFVIIFILISQLPPPLNYLCPLLLIALLFYILLKAIKKNIIAKDMQFIVVIIIGIFLIPPMIMMTMEFFEIKQESVTEITNIMSTAAAILLISCLFYLFVIKLANRLKSKYADERNDKSVHNDIDFSETTIVNKNQFNKKTSMANINYDKNKIIIDTSCERYNYKKSSFLDEIEDAQNFIFLDESAKNLFSDKENFCIDSKYFYKFNSKNGLYYAVDVGDKTIINDNDDLSKYIDFFEYSFQFNDQIFKNLSERKVKFYLITKNDKIEYRETVNIKAFNNDFVLLKFDETNKKIIISRDGKIHWFNPKEEDYFKSCRLLTENDKKRDYLISRMNTLYSYLIKYNNDIMLIPFVDKNNFDALSEEKERIIYSSMKNDVFLKWFDAQKEKKEPGLFLGLDSSTNSKIAKYIISKYKLKYEIIPNLFLDDDTLNIFLCEPDNDEQHRIFEYIYLQRYFTYSGYCIYNLKISLILDSISDEYISNNRVRYSMHPINKNDRVKCLSIANTIKSVLNYNDLNDVFNMIQKIYKITSENNELKYKNQLPEWPNNLNSEKIKKLETEYFNKTSNSIYQVVYHKTNFNNNNIALTKEEEIYNKEINLYHSQRDYVKETIQKMKFDFLDEMKKLKIYNSKWKNEYYLYEIVKGEYSDAIYQYHSNFLGGQSLDIFIPSLKLGIEYQGEQHYMPIDFFGGVDGYNKTLERDLRKLNKCNNVGIQILYWKYSDTMTKKEVLDRITNIVKDKTNTI